ncbi:MAG: peptidoglycan-binding domain-containing protein [Paracoccaceae bacterium]
MTAEKLASMLVVAAGLGACQPGSGPEALPPALASSVLAGSVAPRNGPTPPEARDGACWSGETLPAVFETVTAQTVAQAAKTGTAQVTSTTRHRILRDRTEVWVLTPCPETMSPEFVASLQRALKARGLFAGTVSGALDGETRSALRRFQSALGLDSDRLTLDAAKRLGLSVYTPEEL